MTKKAKHKAKPKKKAAVSKPKKKLNSYSQSSRYKNDSAVALLNNIRPDTGYAVTTPDIDPAESETWNMMLTNPANETLYLWVEDISINFSMSGSRGQSRYRRQFFPRAFNQPVMRVVGRAPNQYQYNLLSSFMREAHYQALKYSETNNAEGRSINGYPLPTVRIVLKDAGKNPKNQSNIKGGHKGLVFEGYLKNIAAGAVKFQFAPQFQFDVIIATSNMTGNVGIYEDSFAPAESIKSWMELFDQGQFGAKTWGQMKSGIDTNVNSATTDAANVTTSFSQGLKDLFKIQ